MRKAVVSWSGGKDSALALWKVREQFEVVGLVTTVTEEFQRISMHGVRRELLEKQAAALDLPLHPVSIPLPCTNEGYEERMRAAFSELAGQGVERVVCGDIFLEDVRRYREERLLGPGMGVFPLWGIDTSHLIQEFFANGFRAVLCCVDTTALSGELAGRELEPALLAEFPPGTDPCGEKGEYHTFVYDGPIFRAPLSIQKGENVLRENRFMYRDLI